MASVDTSVDETSICLTIDKINQLETVQSSSFKLQNFPWQITIFKSAKENTLGFRLACLETSGENWSCAAAASIELRSFRRDRAALKVGLLPFIFSTEINKTSRTIIKCGELMDTNSGYVQNDKIKIDVKIMAKRSTNYKMNLQVAHRTNDTIKVHLTIHEASSLIAATSTPFDFCNTTWKLVVMGPGYQPVSKTKLSCMLWCMNRNPASTWSREILGGISIITTPNQSNTVSAKKVMNFSQQFPRKYFTDMILWSDLLNPSKGYIHPSLDYIVVEVELKIQRIVNDNNTNSGRSSSNNSFPAQTAELCCSICFENMIDRCPMNTDCGHPFCKLCITAWIQEHPYCPLCSQVLTLSQIHRLYLP